jgi:hypothetical protein
MLQAFIDLSVYNKGCFFQETNSIEYRYKCELHSIVACDLKSM